MRIATSEHPRPASPPRERSHRRSSSDTRDRHDIKKIYVSYVQILREEKVAGDDRSGYLRPWKRMSSRSEDTRLSRAITVIIIGLDSARNKRKKSLISLQMHKAINDCNK